MSEEESEEKFSVDSEGKRVFKLSSSINSLGEELKELALREPLGKEMREIGMPLSFDSEGTVEIKMNKMIRYIEKLGNLPKGDGDKLKAKDITNIAFSLIDFFV